MRNVTSSDLQRSTGHHLDESQRRPVVITKHDRPYSVLISFEEFQKLTGQTKRAIHVTQLTDEDAEALRNVKMPSKYDYLNDEMED